MKKLIAVAFDNRKGAEQALSLIEEIEDNDLLSTDDAVVAVRRKDGNVKLKAVVESGKTEV